MRCVSLCCAGRLRCLRLCPPPAPPASPASDVLPQWYCIASDPLLWRNLDLSALHSKLFNPNTASTLNARLRSCRNFILNAPPHLQRGHVDALLGLLAASPLLERLYLQSLGPLLNSHNLEAHFRLSRSRCLMHVDLSHSPVTTPAVVALMDKHRGTLRSLDLSHTAVGDGTLRAVATAKVLRTLDISACTAVSRTSLRNFLCKRFPGCLVTLAMRGLREVKVAWLYDLLKLPSAQALRALHVEACERLALPELAELQAACAGRVEITHDAKEEDDTVWTYRRYIEFLSTDPGLPQRLGSQPGADDIKKELAALGKPVCPGGGGGGGGSSSSSGGTSSASPPASLPPPSPSSSSSRPRPRPQAPLPPPTPAAAAAAAARPKPR